jgi:BirA family transcriptional regulator, biotin operon repressor / biotin---[acetyl-CoA-carboxylase] ligase
MLDLARIARSGLAGHVDYHASLGSTSDRALALAAEGDAPLPLLVLAERQTAGRGRAANRWFSGEGALTFSLVLDASELAAAQRSTVALVAGLAVCEALEALAPRAAWRVKWPNDVFAGGGKVCGILCESVPGWPERLVVGIGVNVNNTVENQNVPFFRAMVELDGVVRDLSEVLLAVLDRLDLRWRDLVRGGFSGLAGDYRSRCLLTGRTLTVQCGANRLIGRCGGIDDGGALLLVTQAGPQTIVAGSIEAWE